MDKCPIRPKNKKEPLTLVWYPWLITKSVTKTGEASGHFERLFKDSSIKQDLNLVGSDFFSSTELDFLQRKTA